MGGRCCSPAFTSGLVKELISATGYNWHDDNTGIYTDSAVFMDDIRECTNLSVGYFNEHSTGEFQNLTYLEDLCEGIIKVDWENLPIERECGPRDTPNPKRKKKKKGDLDDKELGYIFMMVEDIFEDTQAKECVNRHNFMPEKEMLFSSFYDDSIVVSVWIHVDGSITIGKDNFKDIYELEDKIDAVYGRGSRKNKNYDLIDDEEEYKGKPWFDDEEEEEEDDDDNFFEADDIDLTKNDFEDGININDFISDVEALDKDQISAGTINNILTKYNKTIESLIIWIYNSYNDASKTMGLTWDDVDNQFEFDPDYNKPKSSGVDTSGARTFN